MMTKGAVKVAGKVQLSLPSSLVVPAQVDGVPLASVTVTVAPTIARPLAAVIDRVTGVPLPPPLPHVVIPQIVVHDDDDDDDDYIDVDDDDDDDDATIIWDYPGANSPLPHTGDSSDELDDFHSLPTTPAGAQTPVAGTSRGAHQLPFFRPLSLTPEQEATVAKALGRKSKAKKPAASGPTKRHLLRSKGAVSPSGLPASCRK